MLISALLAPIMMLIQSGSVFQILLGRDTGWKPQRRDDGSIPFNDIVRRHRDHTVLGVIAGDRGLLIATSLFAWMSPDHRRPHAGDPALLGSAASWRIGLALKRRGLLVTPEEHDPPPIATRANALSGGTSRRTASTTPTACGRSTRTPVSARGPRNASCRPLRPACAARSSPTAPWPRPSSSMPKRIDDAVTWLKPKERMVVLHDRALIGLLSRLPSGA